MEQRGQLAAMQQLESRSDEELEAETKYKAAAQAILGYRAAERYDAKAARAHFQRALAAAREEAGLTRRLLRISIVMLIVYGGLIGLTFFEFARAPSGFIPPLDRAYFIAAPAFAASSAVVFR